MHTILVQIASYREHELPKTLASCLRHAAHPQRLRFAIVNQYGDETEGQLDEFHEDNRFRIVEQPWYDSRGLGRSRSITDELHVDEDFYLQIDSHMRFLPNWDERLLTQWRQCGHPRAILSSYPPYYKYNDRGEEIYRYTPPNRLVVAGFAGGYAALLQGRNIPGQPDRPTRGALVAGGLQFGPGSVCKEVPAEPGISFNGEEFVDSLRLFTHGYQVYSIVDDVIFHMYERIDTQEKPYFIWQDFIQDPELQEIWREINALSAEVLRVYAHSEPRTLGQAHTRREFENFAGVDFAARKVHPDTYSLAPLPIARDDNWREFAVEPSKLVKVNAPQ